MRPKLVMSIGIPGSGKTTFLQQLPEMKDAIYVCPDEIRQKITGEAADQSQNDLVWKQTKQLIIEGLISRKTVILDATQTEPQYRNEYLSLAKKHNAEVVGYYFTTPLEIALKRNRNRSRVVPETVVKKMHQQLIDWPPSLQEGYSKLQIV